jgi:hypothetical protein
VICPASGNGAVGGAAVAFGLDPVVAGVAWLVGGGGGAAQVAPLGGLAAGHSQRGGEGLPGDSGGAGGGDQDRLEAGQLGLGPAQQHQGVEQVSAVDRGAAGGGLLHRVRGGGDRGGGCGEIAVGRCWVRHPFPLLAASSFR